jgi:hypothetical protein
MEGTICESSRKLEVMSLSLAEGKRRGALDEAGDVKEGRVIELASLMAQQRAQIARWDINIVVFLFAVLILVVILSL